MDNSEILQDQFDTIEMKIGRIFSIFNKIEYDNEREFTIKIVEALFEEIDQPVPKVLYHAHELLGKYIPSIDYGSATESKLITALDRADHMLEIVGVSHDLGVLYEAWESLCSQLEEVLQPDKAAGTEADRKIILKSRMANYRAITEIIHYMFAQCGKITPSIHQSVLAFEKEALKM